MTVGPEFTDAEILRLVMDRKSLDSALKYLYQQYYFLLGSYVESNNGSREDAEDIFQETLLTFIELVRLEKFRGDSSIKTFLYAINRNIWLNELKKRGRQQKREKSYVVGIAGDEPDVQREISNREARNQIFSVIESLGETCKKILLAFYYENLTMNEILQRLDYQNEQVVRNKKAKCMKSLEQKLDADPSLAKNLKNALRYE